MMKSSLRGTVRGVFVGRFSHSLVTVREPSINITWTGVEGDRHAGLTRLSDSRTPHYPRGTEIANTRQISLVSIDELKAIAETLHLPEVLPEWLGANIVLDGIPHLTFLPPSTRLFFSSGAVFVVDGENLPCTGPGKVLQKQFPQHPKLETRFPKAALHKRGIVAWVEKPGAIRDRDEVVAAIPKIQAYPFVAE